MNRFALTRRRFQLLGLSTLGLAACSPGGPGGTGPAEGLLRVGLAGAPDSLDPFVAEFAAAAVILNQIHAPLWSYRPDQGLARSWEANDDRTIWTARLRPGLVWSDGAPLTAEHIVWSVRHAVRPDSQNPSAGDLAPVRGALQALAGDIPLDQIGVSAPDPATVVFELAEPVGVFPSLLREFYPIAPHAYEAHGADWTDPVNFVGAGPYLPRSGTQLSLMLARNPNYFAAAGIAFPSIEVSAIDDASTRLRMFQAGDLDMIQDIPAEAMGVAGIAPRFFEAPRLTYLKPNHARAPLSDVRVRRALSLAVDRDFISEAYYRSFARPAFSPIPNSALEGAALAGRNPDFAPMLGARRETAAALIREAGAEGVTLELLQSGGEREGVAVALADDWRKIGVETTINRTDATGLYAAVDEGRFDLALARFDRGLKTDAWRYLEPFAPGGFAANFGWQSPALAAALARIRAEGDPARRAALTVEAEAIMLGDHAVIPLQHEMALWMMAPGISDKGEGQPLFWADLR